MLIEFVVHSCRTFAELQVHSVRAVSARVRDYILKVFNTIFLELLVGIQQIYNFSEVGHKDKLIRF